MTSTGNDKAKEIDASALAMAPSVVLDPSTPTRVALQHMKHAHSGYALITTGGELCGIFTERDVLLKVIGVEGALDQPVSMWMSARPVCLEPCVLLSDAIRRMREGGFRTMPQVDASGTLLVIRHRSIIRYLVEHLHDHVFNRPPDPDRIARMPEGG